MSDLATHLNMSNKGMSNGEGQRQEVYYVAWQPWEESTSAHLQPSFENRHEI
jgi:hypothetical protein